MERLSTKKLVMCALFAALACVATMSIRIPTPGTGGYIHPGDAVVILCGIFMGPAEAFLAAGIGSCMADLLGGYFIYVPITFVIKGLVAFSCSHLYHGVTAQGRHGYLAVAACGVIDMALVAGGYFLCEIFLYGPGWKGRWPGHRRTGHRMRAVSGAPQAPGSSHGCLRNRFSG